MLVWPMDALLLVAHGSRKQSSNDEVRSLVRTLAQNAGHKFDWVDCAFLELAEPSIPEGVQGCIRNGANSITVLPYFLSAGRHVTVDIPAELAKVKQNNPHIQLKVTSYLGAAEEICDILIRLSDEIA